MTNHNQKLEGLGHPSVVPIPRPLLSSISLPDLREIIRHGVTPFLKDGWKRGEVDNMLYSIVIMDEAATTVRHKISYDTQTVNLKQFVGKRGGFSFSLIWTPHGLERYIDQFTPHLTPPEPVACDAENKLSSMGGYNEHIFVKGQNIADFVCSICMDVVREPMETECGHLFCKTCVEKFLDRSGGKEVQCPMKCQSISRSTIRPLGPFTKRTLMSFKVVCEYQGNGCDWTGVLKDLTDTHLPQCTFSTVQCSGCMKKLLSRDFQKHAESFCEYRIVPCEFCQAQCLFRDIADHLASACDKAPRPCIHADCDYVGPKSELTAHMVSCVHKLERCRFSAYGCHAKYKESEMGQHEVDDCAKHLNLVLAKTQMLEERLMQLENKLNVH
jgi:hypothetical protein